MAAPQKSVPKPINISLVKNPIKILKKLKKNSGAVKAHEPSCALCVVFLFPFGSARKTKKRTRVE